VKYDDETYKLLSDGLAIDRDILDIELIQQANSFFHASEGAAFAQSIRDKKKLALDKVVAELDNDIRDNMTSDGEKVTEGKVTQQINREQDYLSASMDHNKSIHNLKNWEALKDAYRMRADMLKALVSLNNSNFYGEVTGAGERQISRERLRRI
jgi:hypothetical protein